ncbi:MAG: hypothetical protein ABL931_11730 [Usitatibacteraceae bacterium]
MFELSRTRPLLRWLATANLISVVLILNFAFVLLPALAGRA